MYVYIIETSWSLEFSEYSWHSAVFEQIYTARSFWVALLQKISFN